MKKRELSIFLGLLMLLSTLAFSFLSQPPQRKVRKNPLIFVTVWKGSNVYAQELGNGTYIYYLQISRGLSIPLRANPAEAEKVKSNFEPSELFEKTLTAKRLYYLFDPYQKDIVSLAYADLSRFLVGKPFEIIYGVSKPYTEDNTTFIFKDPFNLTEGEFSIVMEKGNDTELLLINNTLIVRAPDRLEMLKAATKVELILARLLT